MTQDFSLSLEIYDREKVLQAIEDFVEVSDISLQGNIISVSAISLQEAEEIFREFMNYVLSL